MDEQPKSKRRLQQMVTDLTADWRDDDPLHGCPRVVWIMGQRWVVKPLEPTHGDEDGNWRLPLFRSGMCWLDKQIIEISPNMHKQQTRITMLHEVMHAVDKGVRSYDMDDDRSRDRIGPRRLKDLNEAILSEGEVSVMSAALYSVLTDPRNEGLSKWLFVTAK